MGTTFESVVAVLAKRFDIDPAEVSRESSFDDINLDSLSQIEFGTALNKAFAVDISDDEMAELSVIGEVVDKLDEKLAEKV
ncbi:acyl carrier protein [Kutzneria buriramensis]|uniref:Acyl carrier protein n=1 Tax=Kutzneria buriramensis TaxID=1045776 RepID=A0A3E0HE49_9PSEU|nr:phosphopantetheine-binding protein [Kutzneria buriramensis]REH43490.1 acyl carrier protein [Kutzneria buriramensis]